MTRILQAMTLLWLCCAGAARAADCVPLAVVKTGLIPGGRYAVPVTLENHPLSLLLDTGGISTTVKWDEARQLGLAVKQADRTLTGVGGSMLNFTLAGDNFSVGELRVHNKPIYVEARTLTGADGTLGSDILRSYDVGIDFLQQKLSLFAPDGCAGSQARGLEGADVIATDISRNGHIRIAVKIDGTTLMATLDTGAAISLLTMKSAALLGIYPASPQVRLERNTGQFRVYSYPFRALEIGRTVVKDPRLLIVNDEFIPGLDSDMVLGVDAIRQLRLTIAYGENRLYIAPAQPIAGQPIAEQPIAGPRAP